MEARQITKKETSLIQTALRRLRRESDPVESAVSYDLQKSLVSPSRRGAGFVSVHMMSKMNVNIPREEHSEEQLKTVTTRGAMKKWVWTIPYRISSILCYFAFALCFGGTD